MKLPPVPDSLDAVPPQETQPFIVDDNRHLPDVNADPLYAFIPVGKDGWHNYDRRGMSLTVEGEWVLLAAATITPDTPFDQQLTLEEGVTTSESEERSFATNFGISIGIPKIGLGAELSASLSKTVSTSVTTHSLTATTTALTASTGHPHAVFWFWQLQTRLRVDGTHIVFGINDPEAKRKLASDKYSRDVMTLDGPGRELRDGGRLPAHRFYSVPYTQRLMSRDAVYRTTQFPPASSAVTMADARGQRRNVAEAAATAEAAAAPLLMPAQAA
jgi:hypothetical protein